MNFTFGNNSDTILTKLIRGFEQEKITVYHFRTDYIPAKQVSEAMLYAIESKIKVEYFPQQKIVTFVKLKTES